MRLFSLHQNLAAPSSTFYAPTLGFASNLSHSIIKETQEDDSRSIGSIDTVSTSVSISDEELALLGAPWAKEGMLCRKQFWETSKRRAKGRNWMDVFVVISKGEFSMFTFGETGPSASASSVGGGNWLVSGLSSNDSSLNTRPNFPHSQTRISSASFLWRTHLPMHCRLLGTIVSDHTVLC